MPLKCRSCGHLNRDQAETCERCGCDLQYSLLFDTVIQNRKEESRFLFPLNVPDRDEMEILPELDEDLDREETSDFNNQGPVVNTPVSLPGKSTSPISRELQEKASHLLILATAELLFFMALFLLLSMLAKVAAPYLILPNWKLAVTCLCYYGFITVSSLYFTGKTTASVLAAAITR